MRIFISPIVDKKTLKKYNLSPAATNFSCNLIDGNIFDAVYSIPSSVVKEKGEIVSGIKTIAFWRLRHFKPLRFFALIFEQIRLFFATKKAHSVWLYNVDARTFFYVSLLRIFRSKVKVYVIVLDFTPVSKKVSFQNVLLHFINTADGIIKLASSDTFLCKNAICLPGIVPNTIEKYKKQVSITPSFLLSGVLNDAIAMPKTVLEVFSKLPECNLFVTGIADTEALFTDYAKKYKNIHYLGYVSYNEYIHLLESVSFCLNTRDKRLPENGCNFPSKVIEYLLYNKIVVSTIAYPQLEKINYIEIPSSVDEMRLSIKEYCLGSNDLLLRDYANQAHKMRDSFSLKAWEDAIILIEEAETNE